MQTRVGTRINHNLISMTTCKDISVIQVTLKSNKTRISWTRKVSNKIL